jgi:hypothetical protein
MLTIQLDQTNIAMHQKADTIQDALRKLEDSLKTSSDLPSESDSSRKNMAQSAPANQQNRRLPMDKGTTYLIGDSILKGLGSFMTKGTTVFTYPGTTASQMKTILSSFSTNPEQVKNLVIHSGSNDFSKPANQIASSLKGLILMAKSRFKNSNLLISGPLYRADTSLSKVKLVNQLLSKVCQEMDVHFVDANHVIGDDCLSAKGIHLNNRGKEVLARVLDDYSNLMELKKIGKFKRGISRNPIDHLNYGPPNTPKNLEGSVWWK